ncbi:UrcA family protein [Maricaulis sp.]|uniref:UrcA family protein n=1 Tax=Maricaulis sp. TaxID=1486257 RepID=UPI003A8E0AFB
MKHGTLGLAITGAALMLAATAPAAQAQSNAVFTFSAEQASLRNDEAVRETYDRLVSQTRAYCEQFNLGNMTSQCEQEVLVAAVTQVANPRFTAYHTARLADQAATRRQQSPNPTS